MLSSDLLCEIAILILWTSVELHQDESLLDAHFKEEEMRGIT